MSKIQALIQSVLFVILFPLAVVADETNRPNPQDGPTDIYTSVVIVDFDAVRDADQSFEASVFFKMS